MADVLKTPKGCVTILSKYDLIDTVRSYMGDEVADYIEKNFKNSDDEAELNERYFQSDYNELEMSCDEYLSALNEVQMIAEETCVLLNEKRMDRKKISEKVQAIINTVSGVT